MDVNCREIHDLEFIMRVCFEVGLLHYIRDSCACLAKTPRRPERHNGKC